MQLIKKFQTPKQDKTRTNINSIAQRERIDLFIYSGYFCCPEISSYPVQNKVPKYKNGLWAEVHSVSSLNLFCSKRERSYTD